MAQTITLCIRLAEYFHYMCWNSLLKLAWTEIDFKRLQLLPYFTGSFLPFHDHKWTERVNRSAII